MKRIRNLFFSALLALLATTGCVNNGTGTTAGSSSSQSIADSTSATMVRKYSSIALQYCVVQMSHVAIWKEYLPTRVKLASVQDHYPTRS